MVLLGIPWELGEHGVTIEYSIETWWEHQNPKIQQFTYFNIHQFMLWLTFAMFSNFSS